MPFETAEIFLLSLKLSKEEAPALGQSESAERIVSKTHRDENVLRNSLSDYVSIAGSRYGFLLSCGEENRATTWIFVNQQRTEKPAKGNPS